MGFSPLCFNKKLGLYTPFNSLYGILTSFLFYAVYFCNNFQFPLWDSCAFCGYINCKWNLTFNSLYGILQKVKLAITLPIYSFNSLYGILLFVWFYLSLTLVYLSIPFMGFIITHPPFYKYQMQLSIPFMGFN